MPLQPVLRSSVPEDVYRQLSGEIYAGTYAPGKPLPAERDLARVLGVSRVAVREALQRLAQAGLVGSRHGSGRTVLDFRRTGGLEMLPSIILSADGRVDLPALRSAMEMRACIGADVARLAALRADAATADALDAIVASMRAAKGDAAALQVLAYSLWDALVTGSGNIAYRLAMNGLAAVYERCFDAMTSVLATEHSDTASYEALARAVRARDAGKARAAAERILGGGLEAIVAALGLFGGDAPPPATDAPAPPRAARKASPRTSRTIKSKMPKKTRPARKGGRS